ncbi:hypothetical protein ACH419_43530, partial [Streptomyces bobili]|uniref:hypothetical protein n=1 Tax=Streptomyces bobili TaxID=67280 RepID=UPI00379A2F16
PDQVRALTVICTYDSLNKIKNGRTAYEFSVVREALHGLHECGPVLFDSLGRPGVVACCSLQPAACRAGGTLSQLSVTRRTMAYRSTALIR